MSDSGWNAAENLLLIYTGEATGQTKAYSLCFRTRLSEEGSSADGYR
jgi:hypothetical protein